MLSHHILIVDANLGLADLCRQALEQLGYTVSWTPDGQAAMILARQASFDLAIISAQLQTPDSLTTLQNLQMLHPDLIGILLAGKIKLKKVIAAMNRGFSGLVESPPNRSELVGAVQQALNIARLRSENTRFKTLMPLYELSSRFIAASTPAEVYEELIEVICHETQASAVSIMMFVSDTGCLQMAASRGLPVENPASISLQPGERVAGWVFEKGQAVILNRASQHQSHLAGQLHRNEIAAAISMPLMNKGKVLGVVNISKSDTTASFTPADLEMLAIVCGQAVMALTNVAAIAERAGTARLQAMFQQYVSPEIAELLISTNHNLLEMGEVCELTVLFADIRNFTSLVQHIPPTELRIFLNQFFDRFADIIFSCQGTLNKFMGDGALAIFGGPVAMAEPSLAAVRAACTIARQFEQLRLSWVGAWSAFATVGIGIGVTRGPMFLGNLGSSRRLDYTVIGTDVNIAQRLAASTLPGQILLTEAVRQDVIGHVTLTAEPSRLLRGLDHHIPLYSICPGDDDENILSS